MGKSQVREEGWEEAPEGRASAPKSQVVGILTEVNGGQGGSSVEREGTKDETGGWTGPSLSRPSRPR